MKKKFTSIITCLLLTLVFGTGCNNDSDEEKVTYSYSLTVDYMTKESMGASDPAIIAIEKKTEDAITEINKIFGDYSQWGVTGRGKTKEEAEKDADSQAQIIFEQYVNQTEEKLNQLEKDFAQWRREYSEQLLSSTENGYRKYSITYMLKREEKISDQSSYGKIVDFGNRHQLEVYTKQYYE